MKCRCDLGEPCIDASIAMGYHLKMHDGESARRPETALPRFTGSTSGHRFLSPSMGRWISRDPSEEEGGANVLLFLGNSAVGRVDGLGLWDVDKNWPTKCGSCSLSYAQKALSGGGGLADTSIIWGAVEYTLCGGGTGPSDPSRIRVTYPKARCETTLTFDPGTDPEAVLPGLGISYRAHEMRHGEANAGAFDWAIAKLAELGKLCCCSIDAVEAVAGAIREATYNKKTADSVAVDCADYPQVTDPKIREQAAAKCALAQREKGIFVAKEKAIDDAVKVLQGSKGCSK